MKILSCALTGITALGFNVSDSHFPINKGTFSVDELKTAKMEMANDSLSFNSSEDSLKCVQEYVKANKIWDDAFVKSEQIRDSATVKAQKLLEEGYKQSEMIWDGGYDYSREISNPSEKKAYLGRVFSESEKYKQYVLKQQKRFNDSVGLVIENVKNIAFVRMSESKKEAKELYCKPPVVKTAFCKPVVKKICHKVGSKKIKL